MLSLRSSRSLRSAAENHSAVPTLAESKLCPDERRPLPPGAPGEEEEAEEGVLARPPGTRAVETRMPFGALPAPARAGAPVAPPPPCRAAICSARSRAVGASHARSRCLRRADQRIISPSI